MAYAISLVYILLIFITPEYICPWLAPYRVQVWTAAAACLVTLGARLIRPTGTRSPQLYLCLTVFCAIGFSTMMQGWFGGILVAWQSIFPSVLVFLLLAFNSRSMLKLRLVQLALIVFVVYVVAVGSAQYRTHVGDSQFVIEYEIHNEQTGEVIAKIRRLRFLGIIADPNDLAQFLLIVLPFVWIWWGRNWIARFLVVIASGVFVYGIYLTQSRGAILGLAALLALALRRRVTALVSGLIMTAVVAAMLAFGFSGGRAISAEGGEDRLQLWSEALQLIKHSPLWGVGYRNFTEYSDLTAHNSFVLVAAELGMPAYFAWLAMFMVSLRQLSTMADPRQVPDTPAEVASQARACRLSLCGYLVTACFLSRAYQPTPYLALGISTALIEMELGRRELHLLPSAGRWAAMAVATGIGILVLIYLAVRLRGA